MLRTFTSLIFGVVKSVLVRLPWKFRCYGKWRWLCVSCLRFRYWCLGNRSKGLVRFGAVFPEGDKMFEVVFE